MTPTEEKHRFELRNIKVSPASIDFSHDVDEEIEKEESNLKRIDLPEQTPQTTSAPVHFDTWQNRTENY